MDNSISRDGIFFHAKVESIVVELRGRGGTMFLNRVAFAASSVSSFKIYGDDAGRSTCLPIKALKAVPCPAKEYLRDAGEMFRCSLTTKY